MAITRVHHHTFTVKDLDRSLEFYRDLLGFTVMYDKLRENLPSYDKVMKMDNVKVRVALLQDPSREAVIALRQFINPIPGEPPTDGHFIGATVLAVQTDDIDADYNKLLAAGVKFTCEPVDVVRDNKLSARLVFAFDPDGIAIELYQPIV